MGGPSDAATRILQSVVSDRPAREWQETSQEKEAILVRNLQMPGAPTAE